MSRRLTPIPAALALLASLFAAGGPVHGTHLATLSDDLTAFLASDTDDRVRVIAQGSPSLLEAVAAAHQLQVQRRLRAAVVLETNRLELSALQLEPAVLHLSGDVPLRPFMAVSNPATGADQARTGSSGLLGLLSSSGVTGKGIGIAIVDSGIAPHDALGKRVVVNRSFVSGVGAGDDYGHGTHVAGIVAGNGSAARRVTSLYTGGIAPGASLLNLRALGPEGWGYTSDVIAAIEWAVDNRRTYNIRVINLSLGHPVVEPSLTDPLCAAVTYAVASGIVVVASAGNRGREQTSPLFGGITSPGNAPLALTVGALNTRGTVERSDDVVATYSSRGPTRYEMGVKPDVVAPGNRIVSLEAANSFLAQRHPEGHVAGRGTNAYFRMSGTSMSAAVISGAAALLLEANPKLDALRLKLVLQLTASFMPEEGLFGAGAGSVNVASARKIADGLVDPLPTATIGGLLVTPSGSAFFDNGRLEGRLWDGRGVRLLSLLDALLAWDDMSRLAWGDLNLFGLFNPLGYSSAGKIMWGDVSLWAGGSKIMWGDEIYSPSGDKIMWGDAERTPANKIMWGDSHWVDADP